jgi:ELWxxDGT repeat protein
VTCTAQYTITQADLAVAQLTNSASASGAGAGTIQNATATIINTGLNGGEIPGGGKYPRGSTVQHDVVDGEWMLQIARCYGAVFETVRNANPQVIDPDLIYPIQTLTVPNVGVVGTPYGPPCIKFYTVVSGDTWQSIADAHNADLEVLREANKDKTLTAGTVLKVPLNSRLYGGIPVTPPPTAVTPRQPIPLNFPPGSPTVTVTGTIGTPDTIRYIFNGTAGQTLSVQLNVPTNDVNLAVYGPNGAVLKALDSTTSWNGTLTATGQHEIVLVSTLGTANKTYTLVVTLTTPAVPTTPPPPAPVSRVADINTGVNGSNPSYLSVFNGQLYFQADAGDGTGAELWRYDSGLDAANRVDDINPGTGGSDPAYLTQFGDFLYFSANGNDGGGRELWRFNGSATGRVTDINPGVGDSNPMYLEVFNNILYFSANGNDGFGTELWQFDGTTASRVTDINPDAGDANPAYLEVFNNALYFSATSNDGTGTELWRFDGTTVNRAADINTGIGNSNPAFLTAFNNVLYFSANANDGFGAELWRYDGTTATRAGDLNPGEADSVPTYLEVFNNGLYFSANGDAAGFELWRFDGANFNRVADINPAGNANPAYLEVYNNQLYFQANGNDNAGAELWRYTGQ